MAREDGGDPDGCYVFTNRQGQPLAEVSVHSIKCLQPSKYLNDEVIQFYIAYLLEQCPRELVRKVHVFDNIFHKLLVETFETDMKKEEDRVKSEFEAQARIAAKENDFEVIQEYRRDENFVPINVAKWRSLDKWFNGVDIFEKDFLIFPVCKDSHWFTIIVCHPSEVPEFDRIEPSPASTDARNRPVPGIMVLDSLGLNNQMITKHVRDFLDYEWRNRATVIKDFHFHNLPQFHPQLPKQTNAFDCGIFLLAYLTAFLKNADQFYRHVRRNTDTSLETLTGFVNDGLVECSRESVRGLIQRRCEHKRPSSKSNSSSK